MVHAEESDSQKVVRAIVLGLIGSLALFWSVLLFSTWNVPEGIFGWNLAPNGTRREYVPATRSIGRRCLSLGARTSALSKVFGRAHACALRFTKD